MVLPSFLVVSLVVSFLFLSKGDSPFFFWQNVISNFFFGIWFGFFFVMF